MSHQVFLSHSHVDKVFADAVCHRLEASGIRCWVAPRDIRPSEDWAEAIINAMDSSKILLLVFSSSSNNSPQVRREVERAVNKGLHVLPFRIENVPLSKSLEYFISTQHWLDAVGGDLDVHLRELSDCVGLLLGQASLSTQPPSPLPSHAPLPAALQEQLGAALAQFIGPIAPLMVRRAAEPGRTARDVVDALALELEEEERKLFRARCSAALL
jgi:hypothetical protein